MPPPPERRRPSVPELDFDTTAASPPPPILVEGRPARQEPPVHARRAEVTHVGMPAPVARGSAPEPPRSLSPPPVSVSTSEAERKLAEALAVIQDLERAVEKATAATVGATRRALLHRVLPWLGAVVVSAAVSVIGYGKAYLLGLKASADRVAAVEERARLQGEELARSKARDAVHDETIEAVDRALKVEAQSNRTERRTRDEKLEAIERRLPKIEGLAPAK